MKRSKVSIGEFIMIIRKHLLIPLLLGFFFFTCPAPKNVHAENIVTIGTGAVTGVYYPTGKAIAKIVNKKESTGGSVFNVNAIIVGDLEFGIVQSDRQYQAWNGIKDWKDRGPQKKLRSICSFHPESIVLIAGDDTGIETLIDLKGKHINIG
jgi:TRAP transporter TAXI family solute receptor